jgi:hypothetical protein
MCCVLTILLVLGPRAGIFFWWLFNPARFKLAFTGSFIWPLLMSIFIPWTTIMYMLVFPGGVKGFEWVWIGLGLACDILWYLGGGFRKKVPGYQGQY